jgi:hypothetical protein
MLDKLKKEMFEPLINQLFLLDLDGHGKMQLQLTSVTSHATETSYFRTAPEGSDLRQEGFTLLFRAPNRPALPQRIYSLEHETLGKMEMIFLVPVAEDENGRYYEAVFN